MIGHPDLFMWLSLFLIALVFAAHATTALTAAWQRRRNRFVLIGVNALLYLFGTAGCLFALMLMLLVLGLCDFHGGCSFNEDLPIALTVLATSLLGLLRLSLVAKRPD